MTREESGKVRIQTVRFSRVLPLPWVIAIGLSTTVGIGVLILLGTVFNMSEVGAPWAPYVLLLGAGLPLVLTLSERSAVLARSDAYSLTRRHGFLWLTFTSGWIQMGGYVALLSVLAWGMGLHLQVILTHAFSAEIDVPPLAMLILGIVALNNLLGTRVNWRLRVTFIYTAMVLLIGFVVLVGIQLRQAALPPVFVTPNLEVIPIAALISSCMWGLFIILSVRDEVHRPTKVMPRALIVTFVVAMVLGALLSLLLLPGKVFMVQNQLPVLHMADLLVEEPVPYLALVYSLLGLIFLLLCLNRAFVSALRVVEHIEHDGFMPSFLDSRLSDRASAMRMILMAFLGVMLLQWFSLPLIAGVAALAFLLSAVVIHAPEMMRSHLNLPDQRPFKLPFHPLFPAMVVVICALLAVNLDLAAWRIAIVWTLVGIAYYALVARRPAAALRRQSVVVEEDDENAVEVSAEAYSVMVGISHPDRAEMLVEAGLRMARARQGMLLVTRILVLADQVPENIKRQRAEQAWEELNEHLENLAIEDVVVRPVVRLASNPEDGILEAVREDHADVLLLGWLAQEVHDVRNADTFLNRVNRLLSCELAILSGEVEGPLKRVLVPTAGGPNVAVALDLATKLVVDEPDARVDVVHILHDDVTEEERALADEVLARTLKGRDSAEFVNGEIIVADSVQAEIESRAKGYDLVLLGSSQEGLVNRAYFGGLPADVAVSVAPTLPVLIMRAAQPTSEAWWVRLWMLVADPLPTLRRERREAVAKSMQDSAAPTIDFYVLIFLAAMIASLGLLQNSAAVIIGAMLVAPLMSPILAMAMSMVLGDVPTLRLGAEATVKGILLAIVVGIVITIISPIDTPTNEILARTQPNILDLMVALASGAAAGYAISRKEVAAALPGVAIAAALVPPLCVVGYGLGTSQVTLASGAMLLFVTNLIAIVLSAALIFLALGFQPDRDQEGELARGLRITLLLLALVSVLLVGATIGTVRQVNQQVAIENIFRSEMVERAALVEDITVIQQGNAFLITALVLAYENSELSAEDLQSIQDQLAEVVDGPVELDATIVQALRSDLVHSAQIRAMTDEFDSLMRRQEIDVISRLGSYSESKGYMLTAMIVTRNEASWTDLDTARLQDALTEAAQGPVTLELTLLEGDQIDTEPSTYETPTPTPTPTQTPAAP